MKTLRILNALKKFVNSKPLRFSMPGHKGREKLLARFNVCECDVTELPAIDNERALRDAEKDCAYILGARHCRFLTDGSTVGIFSMLYAVKSYGTKIIINRAAHKSVYNALKLFGIEPIVLSGDYVSDTVTHPSIVKTEMALDANPDAIGVLYTYPDYYGRAFDIKKIRAILKKRGKLLLIDGAHGAHYKFMGQIYAGDYADLWVDGSHKTMPTFNQGAIVSCNNPALISGLDEGVNLFSTTSPSYPILASVEYGVKYMAERGKKATEKLCDSLDELKIKITKLGLSFMDKTDVYKLAVDFGGNGYDSTEIEKELIKENVHVEMNDGKYILFMFSALTSSREITRLYRAIETAVSKVEKADGSVERALPESGERVMPYIKAVNSETEFVRADNAVGRISADNVGLFPPCYPIIVAGEVITAKAVAALKTGNTFGVSDGKLKVVKGKR